MTGNICISSPFPTITTGTISGSPFCAGNASAAVSVPYTTSSATFSGNTFTAQLSNAAGSFTVPTTIGTLVSNANSGTISATIPAGTAAAAAYRIRVISSNPAVTGSQNTVNLTVNNPAAPTGSSPQTFCASANPTVANLVATGAAGSTIKWYDAASNGTLYTSGTALVNGSHYYASQTVSGCEGSARLDVTVSLTNPAAPTGSSPQTFCASANPTVANLVATGAAGSTIKWYDAASNGTLYTSGTALVNGSHYYASQTVSGCEGSARLDVTVSLTNPAAPTGSSPQTFCASANPTVANLVATGAAGSTIKWYDAASNGTLYTSGTALVNGSHYYASQTVSGCEGSARLDVTVSLTNPAAPTGSSPQTFCASANPTVANLVATGAAGSTIKWYDAASNGTLYTSGTALVNGSHYYASQTVSGCEGSARLDVTVSLTNPAAPTGSSPQTFCASANPTVANLVATGAAGSTIKWYDAASNGTLYTSGTALVNGSHYYASQTVSGCEGISRLDVTVTISDPPAPSGTSSQSFCSSNNPKVADLVATGSGIQWYDAAINGTLLTSGTALVDGAHYYASQTIGGCEGISRFDVTAVVNALVVITSPPSPATQIVCATSNVSYTVGATGTGLTYQWFKGGVAIINGGNKSGASSPTLQITGVALGDDDNYTVQVSGTAPCSPITTASVHLDVDQRATFTAQPVTPQTICQLSPYTISATANGTVLTAVWNHNGTFYASASVSGNVYSLTIPFVAPGDAGNYQLVLDDGTTGCTASNSSIAVLNVSSTSVGGTVGADATVCYGTNSGTLTLSGHTGAVIRWESSTDNFGSVINPIANTTTSQTYTNLTQTTQYRAVVQSGVCLSDNSVFATITVNAAVNFGTVTSGDETICNSGDPANIIFSTAPSGGAGTFTYQWYYKDGLSTCPSGTSTVGWTLIAGATGNSYDPPTGLINSRTYAVLVDATGTPDCGVATWANSCRKVTVNAVVNFGTVNSADQTICINGDPSNITFSTAPSGGAGTFTYQWYYQDGLVACPSGTSTAGWTIISGATGNSYDPPTGLTASRTYAVLVDATGTPDCGVATWANSCRKVTVNAAVDFGTVTSGDETICNSGDPANITFSAAPSGGAGTFTYQWYFQTGLATCPSGTSTVGWTLISGATGNSYDPPTGLTASRTYAVLVDATGSPDCGVATWANSCRKVTVNAAVDFGTVTSGDETICNSGDPANIIFSTAPSGGAGTFTYQWYYKDGLSTCPSGTSTVGWTLIAGATGNSYDPPTGLINSRTYAVLVDATGTPDCGVATWANSCRKVTVNAVVNFGTVNSADQTICINGDPSNITFSTAPSGGAGTFTYQWYYQDGLVACPSGTSTAGWTIISGATGNSYDPPTGLTASRTYAVLVDATGTPDCGVATWANSCRKVTVNAAVDFGTVTSGDETICNSGDPANITFSAAPSGGAGTFTYQWYFQTGLATCPSGTSTVGWTLISGATGNSYDPPTGLTASRTYAVLVDATGSPDCGVATWANSCRKVTVNAAVNFGTVTSGDQTICNSGDPANIIFSTAPSGGAGTFTYQWYYKDGLSTCPSGTSTVGWTLIAGATGNSYDPPTGLINSRTYAVLVDATGTPDCGVATWANSCRKVTVNAVVNFGTLTSGNEAQCTPANPSTINFSTAPSGGAGTFSYQWYYQDGISACPSGTSTVGWTLITGATGNSYNPPAGLTTSRTYAVLVDATGSPDCGVPTWASNCRQVTVNPLPTAGAITGTKSTVCIGSTITLSSNASGPAPLTYTWSSSNTGVATVTSAGVVTGVGTGTTNITYTVVDGNGCSSTSTNYPVTVTKPTAGAITQASGLTSVCINSTLQLTSNATGTGTLIYTWISSVPAKATVSTTGLVTGVTAGTSNITYTVTDGNGCSTTSAAYVVTVLAIPTGSLVPTETSGTTPNDNIICAGDAVTFTAPAGNNSYTFYVNGIKVQGPSTDNTYGTTALTGGEVVTVDVANGNNCGATFTAPAITVNPLPVGTLVAAETSGTAGDNIICPGSNVTFTATAGFSNYNFKVNGSSVVSGSSNIYSSTTLTNGASVTVDVTNSNGCISTFGPQVITVSAVPVGTLSASPGASFCAGTNVTFTATSGFALYDFRINGVSQQNTAANTYSTNALTNGQVVSVIVTNAGGCSTAFNSIAVTVNALPTGALTATETSGTPNDNSICANSPVTFTATSGFSTYDFQVNGVSKQNTAANTYTSSTLANNDVVTVVVKSGSNCFATFNAITITVVASPTGALTATETSGTTNNDNIICAGDNIDFTATAGFANYNFQVNGMTVQNGTGNTFSSIALVNGDVVTVDVTNSNSCVTTFNAITMVVNALPTGTLAIAENSGNAPLDNGIICTGATVVFTAPNGFTNYNFLLNGASIQNSTTLRTYTTTTLANGDKVTVAVTNAGGCVGLLNEYTITVNPLPTVSPIAGASSVCLNGTTTFSNSTGTGIWNTLDPGVATIDAAGLITPVATGTATITFTYTNTNGCSLTVSKTITVNPLPAVAPIIGNVNMCTNSSAVFMNATTGGSWSSSAPAIAAVDASGNVTTGVSTGNVVISYTTAPDANGCTNTATINVNVSASPTIAAIVPATSDICVGGTVTLTDATPAGVWTTSDASIATVNSSGVVTTVGTLGGTVTITYTVTPSCGTPLSQQATVNINPLPAATTASGAGTFCGSTTITAANGSDGTMYFQGTTSNGTSTLTPSSSEVVTTSGTYYFRAQSAAGCWGPQGSVIITINPVPAIVTVSGGGTFCGSTVVTATGGAGGIIYFQGTTLGGTSTALGGSPQTVSASGTYYFRSQSAAGCWGPEGSVAVVINAIPATTTVSGGGTFCGSTSITASGGAGGTIYFQGTTTGGTSILLGGSPQTILSSGTYYFRSKSAAGCWGPEGSVVVVINPLPTATISGTASVCQNDASPTITFTGANGTAPYTFTYNIGGGPLTTVSVGNTATVAAPTATVGITTYTLMSVKDASSTTCSQNQGGTVTITVKAPPPAFTITPASASICPGVIQPLSASIGSSTSGSQSAAGASFTIPDASFFGGSGSRSSNATIAGVPAGAVINSISVTFSVSHTYDADLILNIKAPNGSVLNLVRNKGGSGNDFNATINSISTTSISGNGPINGTFAPDAFSGVGAPNASNVTNFSSLFSVPNGTWTFGAEDETFHFGTGTGSVNSWSIVINYTILPTPVAVVWSPVANLYTDASATTAYASQSLSTVYIKSNTPAAVTYTATATNAANCSTTKTVSVTVGSIPTVTISADYCVAPGKVRLTANSSPAATSYLWSNGATTQSTDVNTAGNFDVTVFSGGGLCPGKASINVASELVTNGDFEAGNVGFISPALGPNQYQYRVDGAGNNELVPEGLYGIGPNPQTYHPNFWGKDHTTGTGNFMIINGFPNGNPQPIAWQETVSVLPNTTYYFSAWGMSVNASGPFAQLQFNVNGMQVGTNPTLPAGVNNINNNGWTQFYGTWTSGPTVTTAIISITDLQNAVGGNDFGLDDISFGTLSTFINLESAPGTDAQTICANTPLIDIVYSVGNGNPSGPTVTGLPTGVTSSYAGDQLTIIGIPTTPGNYTYTITTTGCNPQTATGTITVQGQKITLSSGSASPFVCLNAGITSIVYTLSGTATGAMVTGLPPGVTGTPTAGNTFTISGTPTSAAGSPYTYTITTSGGSCNPVTATGTITVQSQTIALNAGDNDNQTVCINSPIANIRYNVGGTAAGATVSNLPPGVSSNYSGGIFTIIGSPTSAAASPYTYTITTTPATGACDPVSITGKITVTPVATLTLTSGTTTNPQTVCKGSAIADITYAVSNGTGASASGLPTGLSLNYSAGVFTISGTPTAAPGTYNYTVTATGGCPGVAGTATGSVTIQAQTISLTSGSVSPSVCSGVPMTTIVYTVGGTATGASVAGLPANVSGVYDPLTKTFTISGIPMAPAGPYLYTITTSGTCAQVTAMGTITVQPAAIGGTLPALVSSCSGASGTLTLSGQTGSIVRWEYSTDGTTWIPVTNTTISLTYNVTVPTMYRVVVGNGCGNVNSSVAMVGIHNLWVGGTDNNWNTASNWSDGQVPTATPCLTVTIPAVTLPNVYPVLNAGAMATITNLVINSGASLTVTGNTLQIKGLITNNGTFDVTNGAIEFNGMSGGQTIPANAFMGNKIKDLIISNNVSLAGQDSVTGSLTFGAAASGQVFTTGGNLTLKSTAAGTANVGQILNGNSISGDVWVERYISAKRAWRFLSVPTNTTQKFHDAWQEGMPQGSTTQTTPAGYGTQITDKQNPTAANGFDYYSQDGPSVKKYDLTATGTYAPYRSITSTITDDIKTNEGIMTFVRGDRRSAGLGATPYPTVLRTKGALYSGIQSVINVAANQFVSVGNPYASVLDMNKIYTGNATNLQEFFYLWDPYGTGPGNLGFGSFQTFFRTSDGKYHPTTQNGSYLLDPYSYIHSGQGFFMHSVIGSAGSLTFNENAKAITPASTPLVFRPASTASEPILHTRLIAVNTDATADIIDGVVNILVTISAIQWMIWML